MGLGGFEMFQEVSSFKMFQEASRCFKMFQDVSRCCKMLQDLSRSFKIVQGFSRLFKTFQDISRSFKILKDLSRCFKGKSSTSLTSPESWFKRGQQDDLRRGQQALPFSWAKSQRRSHGSNQNVEVWDEMNETLWILNGWRANFDAVTFWHCHRRKISEA